MAIFNFLENFFFISLAITFGLMLMLVYHFKERITVSEKRIDTINDVLITVVKELKHIQFAASTMTLSSQIPVVPPTMVPFPETVIPNKTNAVEPAEHIYYDISEVKPNTVASSNAPHVSPVSGKIIVSDVDDDTEDEDEDDGYSEESGSDVEENSEYGSEKEEDASDLGEDDTVSSTSEEDDTVCSENEDEHVPDLSNIVSEEIETVEHLENIHTVLSPSTDLEPTVLSETDHPVDVDVDVELDVELEVVDADVVGEPEARNSAPTIDSSASDLSATYSLPIVSIELSDITEIVEPAISDTTGAEEVVVSSVIAPETEPEPEPEPIIPVSEPREEKPAVVVSRDAKEQKKEVYRKMSIHQLRTIAISSGLSADNKMKKADLIRLLETLDDEEDQ